MLLLLVLKLENSAAKTMGELMLTLQWFTQRLPNAEVFL